MVSKPAFSLNDLDYTTRTQGWRDLSDYWDRLEAKQEAKVRKEERYLRDGKPSKVQYELGVLDGIRQTRKGPDFIKMGLKLRHSRPSPRKK